MISEVGVDQVVARIVPLRHHIWPFAVVVESVVVTSVASLSAMQAPMLGCQSRCHGLKRRHDHRPKLGGEDVVVVQTRRLRGDLDGNVCTEGKHLDLSIHRRKAVAVLVVAVRLNHRRLPRCGQRVAIRQAVQLVNSCRPAERWARRPNGTGVILFRHHSHHKRCVDLRRAAHRHRALIAAVPDDDGGMRGKATHLVPQLGILHRRPLWSVALLRVHHVVEDY
mmetsp:Transcript_53142/g.123875  ORF Transcript_53142/g.123875 Transcript_53142/m.123875 type:complete len:223 (-) Transcript_53142:132-800(-)